MKPIELPSSTHHTQRFIRNFVGATIIIFIFFVSPIFIVGTYKYMEKSKECDSLKTITKIQAEKVDSFKNESVLNLIHYQKALNENARLKKDVDYLKSKKRMTKIMISSDTSHSKKLKETKK